MNFYDVLAAEKWDGGIPTMNFFDLLFAQSVGGGKNWQVYEGTLPATLNANGSDLRQYQIWGNVGGVGEEVDITGLSEPLYGMQTYADSLNLSTGILTRRIKKLILTGEENWTKRTYNNPNHTFEYSYVRIIREMCSHYATYLSSQIDKVNGIYLNNTTSIILTDLRFTTATDFKSYLAAQYAAGTPVTVWHVLAEPEVSTITVPSGLTGTLEGYLIQDGTPTPEAPIYPTANGVKQAGDTYSIKYGYELDMGVKSENLFDKTVAVYKKYLITDGSEADSRVWGISDYIKIAPNTAYIIKNAVGENPCYCIYGKDKNFILGKKYNKRQDITFITDSNAAYIRMSLIYDDSDARYNLDNLELRRNTTTPIYIGDDPLEKDEYVDYQSQKVYRMIDGTLTPTDPPVPLPALPTLEGETVVDYAGESVAQPEKVVLEYAKGGN